MGKSVEPDTLFKFTGDPANGAASPINDIHFWAETTVDMYYNWYTAYPMATPITVRAHYNNTWGNARYDPATTELWFGDGTL
jgi:Zn-dependent metalloprotease